MPDDSPSISSGSITVGPSDPGSTAGPNAPSLNSGPVRGIVEPIEYDAPANNAPTAPESAVPPTQTPADSASPPPPAPAPTQATAESAPKPTAPDAPTTSSFDEALEIIGTQMGLTKQEVQSLGTGEQRYQALRTIARLKYGAGDQPAQPPAPQQVPPAPVPAPLNNGQPQPDAKLPFQLDPTIVDESVIKGFEALHGQHSQVHQTIQQLGGMIQQLQAALTSIENERSIDTLESYISSLGDEWRDVYGDKPFRDMEPGSPGYQAAMRLLQEAAGESIKMRALNPNMKPRVRTLFEKAHAALHGKRIAERAQKQIVDQMRDSAGRFISAANGRPATGPNENPVLSAIRERLKAHGMETDSDLDL